MLIQMQLMIDFLEKVFISPYYKLHLNQSRKFPLAQFLNTNQPAFLNKNIFLNYLLVQKFYVDSNAVNDWFSWKSIYF
jgi:hypothetical protein